ncbi:MAG: glycoside-pentoside-hexuronide (GPH):cation symporter [Tenericutes bacterium]|jgi:GPH family glycoside/pentoside/hexuronide:cation symporter|nr:glycoside-pentoside-hexuronide (GPH):cation symporter [Mycoplasmatota bacterium]
MDTRIDRTSTMEKTSYGAWFVGQNIIYMIVISYLAIFLTDEVGILEAAVGTLFLVARIWDAVNDPILGGIVDKYQPKKGKFMPWINGVTIFLPIITIFLFWNFNGSGTFNIVYAYLSYIIWGMLYTISDVPIFALATTMTEKTYERTKLIAIGRLAAGVASMIIGLVAPMMIVSMGYTNMVIILMGIALIVMLPLRFYVKERVIQKRERPVTLKTMFNAVFNNKYLLVFYISYIAVTATFTTMTIAPYFAKWNLGNLELLTTIFATLAIPMILIPILLPLLVRKFGKYKIFMIGMGVSILFSAVQYFVGYENFIVFLIINFIRLTGLLLPMTMNGMFSADCVEYGAYVNGERNEGVTFSVQTFSTKLGSAFSAALALFVISAYGYVGTATAQTDRALEGIWVSLTLIPIIGLVIAFVVFGLMYKLHEDDVEIMVKEMKQKDNLEVQKP